MIQSLNLDNLIIVFYYDSFPKIMLICFEIFLYFVFVSNIYKGVLNIFQDNALMHIVNI